MSVNTTVSVPDGGTVLMGGLKRLSEGRNEFGPPVISKIPYLNRLFKNVGYGREAQSLLIIASFSTFRDGSGRSSDFSRESFYREGDGLSS